MSNPAPTGRRLLNRDAFFGEAQKPARRLVDVPALKGAVWVHGLTARERTEFERPFTGRDGKPIAARQAEVRERLVIACARDAHGRPLFSADDLARLGDMRADVIEPIVNAAQQLCGMSSRDLEGLEGN